MAKLAAHLHAEEAAFLAKYLIGGSVSPENMKIAMKAVVDENDPLKRAALLVLKHVS